MAKKDRYYMVKNDGTIKIVSHREREKQLIELRKIRKRIYEIMEDGCFHEVTFRYGKMPLPGEKNNYFSMEYE